MSVGFNARRYHASQAIVAHLLHDTGLPLGEGNVATRLVRDELDLNLAALTAWLVIIIVVVVGGRGPLTLDPTVIGAANGAAIAHRVIIEGGGRSLVVLVGDIGHGGVGSGGWC